MTPRTTPLGRTEFIAMMAMIMATVAFSTDAMLPALPQIGAELSPDAPNRAQLIVTSFLFGLGVGTLIVGPLADRFGRKPVILYGAALYCFASVLCFFSNTLDGMLAARVVMGIGSAAPRVLSVAMVRDLYSGRDMARILSFIMIIFTIFPAMAPAIGAGIMALTQWRGIFAAFAIFATLSTGWLMLRQPETLETKDRRPLRIRTLWSATREVLAHPTARLSIMIQTLTMAMLFTVLSSTQPVFDVAYGQGAHFHYWFAGISLSAISASLLNAKLVMRMGMRAIIKAMFIGQIALSATMAIVVLIGLPTTIELMFYVVWTASVFFQVGLTIGNLNTLALEPMGHIAGTAASLVTATATVGSVIIAVPLGLSFDGTPLPFAIGFFILACLAFWLTTLIRRDTD